MFDHMEPNHDPHHAGAIVGSGFACWVKVRPDSGFNFGEAV